MQYHMNMPAVRPKLPFASLAKVMLSTFAVVIVHLGGMAFSQGLEAAKGNVPVLQFPLTLGLQSVVIPVRVNDVHTVSCILDTGMPTGLFLFDPNTAAKCDLSFVGVANVAGVGKAYLSARVALQEKLSIETISWSKQQVVAFNGPSRMAHLGVDGAIGATIFQDYVVQLDFDKSLISLFSPESFDESGAGSVIPIEIRNTKAFLKAAIHLDGKDTAVDLLLDTGANNGFSLHPSSDGAILPPKPVVSTYLGSGVGGDITGSFGRISSLTLGEHVLKNVATAFPDGSGIVEGDNQSDGTHSIAF